MSNQGLAAIYLKEALQQEGCPICRCCAWHGTRYIQMLLWEHVNDAESRLRLIHSLGFCQLHSTQMLEMERSEHGMTLGNSILYESLIRAVLLNLEQTRRSLTGQGSWKARLRRFFQRLGGRRNEPPGDLYLRPSKGCRACEINREAAQHYGNILLKLLARDEIRALYAQSDGVCLPHLRAMLRHHPSGDGIHYVLAQMAERLDQLQADLDGLRRKHTISAHDAPLTAGEAHSIERAIAFLTGSTRPTLREE